MTEVHSRHTVPGRSLLVSLALLVAMLVVLPACGGAGQAATGASLYDQVRQRGVLKVGFRPDDPPHSSLDAQGQFTGFDVDVATAIAKRWNVRLQPVKVDELTRISFLQNGRIDLAVTSISTTKSRAKVVDFSETYFFSTQSFLVRRGMINQLSDMVGKRVAADRGGNAGTNWGSWLQSHGYPGNPDVVFYSDKHLAVDAVKQGTVAGYASDYELLAGFAKPDPTLTVLNDPGGIGHKYDGIAMHKNDSALVLAVNLALQDIQSSGEYDTIYNRWFGSDSATPMPRLGSIEVWPS
jgi:polar amino acid transport system substrate-binding protein